MSRVTTLTNLKRRSTVNINSTPLGVAPSPSSSAPSSIYEGSSFSFQTDGLAENYPTLLDKRTPRQDPLDANESHFQTPRSDTKALRRPSRGLLQPIVLTTPVATATTATPSPSTDQRASYTERDSEEKTPHEYIQAVRERTVDVGDRSHTLGEITESIPPGERSKLLPLESRNVKESAGKFSSNDLISIDTASRGHQERRGNRDRRGSEQKATQDRADRSSKSPSPYSPYSPYSPSQIIHSTPFRQSPTLIQDSERKVDVSDISPTYPYDVPRSYRDRIETSPYRTEDDDFEWKLKQLGKRRHSRREGSSSPQPSDSGVNLSHPEAEYSQTEYNQTALTHTDNRKKKKKRDENKENPPPSINPESTQGATEPGRRVRLQKLVNKKQKPDDPLLKQAKVNIRSRKLKPLEKEHDSSSNASFHVDSKHLQAGSKKKRIVNLEPISSPGNMKSPPKEIISQRETADKKPVELTPIERKKNHFLIPRSSTSLSARIHNTNTPLSSTGKLTKNDQSQRDNSSPLRSSSSLATLSLPKRRNTVDGVESPVHPNAKLLSNQTLNSLTQQLYELYRQLNIWDSEHASEFRRKYCQTPSKHVSDKLMQELRNCEELHRLTKDLEQMIHTRELQIEILNRIIRSYKTHHYKEYSLQTMQRRIRQICARLAVSGRKIRSQYQKMEAFSSIREKYLWNNWTIDYLEKMQTDLIFFRDSKLHQIVAKRPRIDPLNTEYKPPKREEKVSWMEGNLETASMLVEEEEDLLDDDELNDLDFSDDSFIDDEMLVDSTIEAHSEEDTENPPLSQVVDDIKPMTGESPRLIKLPLETISPSSESRLQRAARSARGLLQSLEGEEMDETRRKAAEQLLALLESLANEDASTSDLNSDLINEALLVAEGEYSEIVLQMLRGDLDLIPQEPMSHSFLSGETAKSDDANSESNDNTVQENNAGSCKDQPAKDELNSVPETVQESALSLPQAIGRATSNEVVYNLDQSHGVNDVVIEKEDGVVGHAPEAINVGTESPQVISKGNVHLLKISEYYDNYHNHRRSKRRQSIESREEALEIPSPERVKRKLRDRISGIVLNYYTYDDDDDDAYMEPTRSQLLEWWEKRVQVFEKLLIPLYRGHCERKRLRQENDAARKIQLCWKAYQEKCHVYRMYLDPLSMEGRKLLGIRTKLSLLSTRRLVAERRKKYLGEWNLSILEARKSKPPIDPVSCLESQVEKSALVIQRNWRRFKAWKFVNGLRQADVPAWI